MNELVMARIKPFANATTFYCVLDRYVNSFTYPTIPRNIPGILEVKLLYTVFSGYLNSRYKWQSIEKNPLEHVTSK